MHLNTVGSCKEKRVKISFIQIQQPFIMASMLPLIFRVWTLFWGMTSVFGAALVILTLLMVWAPRYAPTWNSCVLVFVRAWASKFGNCMCKPACTSWRHFMPLTTPLSIRTLFTSLHVFYWWSIKKQKGPNWPLLKKVITTYKSNLIPCASGKESE